MKLIIVCILLIVPVSFGLSSLLEMSQTLWTKLLNGGLSNIGTLDPLRIPIVKVDQSQGRINYRIILRNIEILGLNDSSLESIHVARGSVKTNLSDHEAGYVTYNDRNAIDFIRYRFHTVVKEPYNNQNDHEDLRVEPIEKYQNTDINNRNDEDELETRRRKTNRHQENHQRYTNNEEYNRRYVNTYEHEQQNHYQQRPQTQKQYHHQHNRGQDEFMPHKEKPFTTQENMQQPNKQISSSESNYQKHQQIPQIEGFRSTPNYSATKNSNNRNNNENNYNQSRYLIYAQTRENSDYNENQRNKYHNDQKSRENYEQPTTQNHAGVSRNVEVQQSNGRFLIKHPTQLINNNKPCVDVKNVENIKVMNERQLGVDEKYEGSSERLENQPGYVDILYADEKSKKMRHFGNLRIETQGDKTVYSLEDIMRDLDNHRRFIIHNFTESELLSKRNDVLRMAEETRRIKDMVRYAKEFQEKQGYFEEGMELMYHYGNENKTKVYDGKRMKRAHEQENEDEDDIMHVIIKIRVPLLRVKADYVLMGKVKDQVLRGNGQFIGNFTELIGDFTVELKKSEDQTLIVRAARAKLEAAHHNIKLEGIDKSDAVTEILTQGAMAAEAIAAMLADDLATKALNESATDSMIYRMYKEINSTN